MEADGGRVKVLSPERANFGEESSSKVGGGFLVGGAIVRSWKLELRLI